MAEKNNSGRETWENTRKFRFALGILAIFALILMIAGMMLSLTTSYGEYVFLLGIILYALHIPVRETLKQKLYENATEK